MATAIRWDTRLRRRFIWPPFCFLVSDDRESVDVIGCADMDFRERRADHGGWIAGLRAAWAIPGMVGRWPDLPGVSDETGTPRNQRRTRGETDDGTLAGGGGGISQLTADDLPAPVPVNLWTKVRCRLFGICPVFPRPDLDHPLLSLMRRNTAQAERIATEARQLRESGNWVADMARGDYHGPRAGTPRRRPR